ncbi:universal stress protein [Natrialba swarupiae]|uniref:Universal stress protein n=1 Tax=Natrialba swarupiae TaxID=2448032 RepID=A0A5D5ARN8_9EURY|nr:universal stress protein [Natrialba swarupiae]TYT62140.1 universal stress protein [Natrialba swarupiae]
MARTILVPHDGSPHAQDALEYVLETFPRAEIVLFHAIDPFDLTDQPERSPLTERWLDDRREDTAELFDEALADLEMGDATVDTETAVGSPGQTIVAAVDDVGADQIVVGTRGRGNVAKARVGSTAELVVRRADVPVTVVR